MPGPTPRYWELAPGLNNVGSYQVSGKPFVSGGATAGNAAAVKFPAVSRWVYVVNPKSTALRVGFSEIGISGSNYFTVPANSESPVLEVKVSELWIYGPGESAATADVVAGLTAIEPPSCRYSSSIGGLQPSWSGSAGVG